MSLSGYRKTVATSGGWSATLAYGTSCVKYIFCRDLLKPPAAAAVTAGRPQHAARTHCMNRSDHCMLVMIVLCVQPGRAGRLLSLLALSVYSSVAGRTPLPQESPKAAFLVLLLLLTLACPAGPSMVAGASHTWSSHSTAALLNHWPGAGQCHPTCCRLEAGASHLLSDNKREARGSHSCSMHIHQLPTAAPMPAAAATLLE